MVLGLKKKCKLAAGLFTKKCQLFLGCDSQLFSGCDRCSYARIPTPVPGIGAGAPIPGSLRRLRLHRYRHLRFLQQYTGVYTGTRCRLLRCRIPTPVPGIGTGAPLPVYPPLPNGTKFAGVNTHHVHPLRHRTP